MLLAVFWFLSVFPHFHDHSCISHGIVFEGDEHGGEPCAQCGFHASVGMALTVFFLVVTLTSVQRQVPNLSVSTWQDLFFQPILPRPPPSFRCLR